MTALQLTKMRRISSAREILQKEVLPHLGIAPNCENKKVWALSSEGALGLSKTGAMRRDGERRRDMEHREPTFKPLPSLHPPRSQAYFLGYMVHRTLQAALRRRELDDRDHYGNKRLDLAGPLMAYLFRTLFKKLTKDLRLKLTRAINKGKQFNVETEIDVSRIFSHVSTFRHLLLSSALFAPFLPRGSQTDLSKRHRQS
jgi:DNA-directed RNA polymerase II subunit RPB2